MKGFIEIFKIEGGVWHKLGSCSNNIMNSGYDAMARAFAGDSNYVVNGMYLEYVNGTPTEPTIPLDRTIDHYTNLADPYGYVRIRTTSEPIFSSSDHTTYTSNVATFTGITDGISDGGAPIIDGTSKFFSIGLAAIPGTGSGCPDTLVSAAPIKVGGTFSPQLKLANTQLGFRWSLQLGDY